MENFLESEYYPTILMGNFLNSEYYPTNLMGNFLDSEYYQTNMMENFSDLKCYPTDLMEYPNCHLTSVRLLRNILTSDLVPTDGSSGRWQLGFSEISARCIDSINQTFLLFYLELSQKLRIFVPKKEYQ